MTTHEAVSGSAQSRRQMSASDAVAPAVDAMKVEWRARRERLWLGLVAVPLAMTATGLMGLWWTWPVLLAGAWACTNSWRWLWLLTLELGIVGVLWGFLGARYLARYPDQRALVGAVWVAFALVLGTASAVNRWGHSARFSALRGRIARRLESHDLEQGGG